MTCFISPDPRDRHHSTYSRASPLCRVAHAEMGSSTALHFKILFQQGWRGQYIGYAFRCVSIPKGRNGTFLFLAREHVICRLHKGSHASPNQDIRPERDSYGPLRVLANRETWDAKKSCLL